MYDVDGNEYVDLHGGYGVSLAGHAHPAIVEAVRARSRRGTHFAQPTETALAAAAELSRRFGLPLWRFGNSGTEATMDAVHLMRAITGRDLIIKVEGCYHGHHDSVQVSVCPDDGEDDLGPAGPPARRAASSGIPQAITDLTVIVGFNDLAAVRRSAGGAPRPDRRHDPRADHDERRHHPARARLPGRAEGPPARPRRAADLRRGEDRPDRRPGGATGVPGVTPDIVCLAKAIGGGISVAAIGGTAEVMAHVADGDYEKVGTFNGNPLAMAASRAMLTEVATPDAYERIEQLRTRPVEGLERAIAAHGLDAQVVSVGAKGCVVFTPEPVRNFRDFLGVRRLVQPRALALPAQRRGVPAAVGQDRAVADVGAARRGRHRQVHQ